MATAQTRELVDGKCIEGHEVEILTNGYGLCAVCLANIQGYSDLYTAPKE